MEDVRSEISLRLVSINKCLRLVCQAIHENNEYALIDCIDKIDYNRYAQHIVSYIRSNPDLSYTLSRVICNFSDTAIIRKYIIKSKAKGRLKIFLTNLADAADLLSSHNVKRRVKITDLPEELNSQTVIDELDKAVNAKYLKSNYQPTLHTKSFELYLIAHAVSDIARIPRNRKLVYFKKLWKDACLVSPYIPKNCTRQINRIMKLYSEADFSGTFAVEMPLIPDRFVYNGDKKRFQQAFGDLRILGYIDKSSCITDWVAMIGYSTKIQKKPISWSGDIGSLYYFIDKVFYNNNEKSFATAEKVFTLKSKSLRNDPTWQKLTGTKHIVLDKPKDKEFCRIISSISKDG